MAYFYEQWDKITYTAIAKCKEIQGQPVIIHNEEHQSYWGSETRHNWTNLGLVCDSATKQWKWAEWTVDYKNTYYDSVWNEDCSTTCS
ncbi:hypothetical protein PENTCL1PPCAC_502 [Pristionchus entomophagus]|uniref:C-type lectin domain-containing protein n=1 Tax=Pristionchus entomophagus TaxID=358040 RepID=A0AAV5S6F7_9BILA|nr:hypothetical protein PENTCL1PPCAC_502 [Pristionchus entomophagus]